MSVQIKYIEPILLGWQAVLSNKVCALIAATPVRWVFLFMEKMMKVRDLITKLLDYNLDAEVCPRANNKRQPFSISWGGDEKKTACNEVFIDCDDLNQHEAAG